MSAKLGTLTVRRLYEEYCNDILKGGDLIFVRLGEVWFSDRNIN
jgi:hypothetical protein